MEQRDPTLPPPTPEPPHFNRTRRAIDNIMALEMKTLYKDVITKAKILEAEYKKLTGRDINEP